MKSYKEYNKIYIGGSDKAELTVVTNWLTKKICFGEDGDYLAYMVDDEATIGDHYKEVFSSKADFIEIHDDQDISYVEKFDNYKQIKIYRAGMRGIIIKIEETLNLWTETLCRRLKYTLEEIETELLRINDYIVDRVLEYNIVNVIEAYKGDKKTRVRLYKYDDDQYGILDMQYFKLNEK